MCSTSNSEPAELKRVGASLQMRRGLRGGWDLPVQEESGSRRPFGSRSRRDSVFRIKASTCCQEVCIPARRCHCRRMLSKYLRAAQVRSSLAPCLQHYSQPGVARCIGHTLSATRTPNPKVAKLAGDTDEKCCLPTCGQARFCAALTC